MDSRKLAYFVAVADHAGFTAASKAVFVSQPALSLAVKDLEAEVGAQLFTRIGHHIRLTPAGAALLEPARQVLRDLETGQAAVAAVTGLLAGSLSLASLPTLAADPMARLVGEFRRHYRGVRVDLAAPEDSDDLFALVQSGTCELGLTDAADVPPTLAALSLGTQELVFILPPGSAPAGGGPLETLELGDIPLVVAPAGTSTRRLVDQQFAALGRQPTLAVISAQREAILPLVMAGAGAALVPEAMALIAEKLGAVVARPNPTAVRDLVLVHRLGPLSPAASRFAELSTGQTRTESPVQVAEVADRSPARAALAAGQYQRAQYQRAK
jgi:LysR family transcriptional regulator, carnitine catabolism transcriptional activator